MTLDNPANPVVRFRNAMPWRVLKRLGLVPYPTGATMKAEEFQKLLERTGFQVSAATTLLHVPRSAAVLMARLLSHLPGSGPSSWFSKCARMFEALGSSVVRLSPVITPRSRLSGPRTAAAPDLQSSAAQNGAIRRLGIHPR